MTIRRITTQASRLLAVAVLTVSGVATAVTTTDAAAPVSVAQLKRSARVPANCEMPAMTIHGGVTPAKYHPREGSLGLTGTPAPIRVNLDRGRAKELVVRYDCTAGGVGWPEMILIYRDGPRLAGWVDLAPLGKQEHASVTSWGLTKSGLNVTWMSYEGAGFDVAFHSNTLRLVNGKPSFRVRKPTVSGDAVATSTTTAFLAAAVRGDQATMKRLASPAALKSFDAMGKTWSSPSRPSVVAESGTFAPVTQATIVSGKPRPGNWALIFDFTVALSPTGGGKIQRIVFGGDAG